MDKGEGEKGGGDDRDRLEDSERQIEMKQQTFCPAAVSANERTAL